MMKPNQFIYSFFLVITVAFYSCNNRNERERHSVNIYNRCNNRVDTIEYIVGKPLGKYNWLSDNIIFTDSILLVWNRVSMENIKKIDPELLNDGNYVKYQILQHGDNNRLEFWRMINCFYSSWYRFEKGFYVVETFNRSGHHHYAYYLIAPNGDKYMSYQFHFGIFPNCGLIAYLKDIKEINRMSFYSYYSELKKQKVFDELIWGPSEFIISYFHKDTIESYVSVDYGNFDIIPKMGDLINGIQPD